MGRQLQRHATFGPVCSQTEEQHEELQALRERVADMLDELNAQTRAVGEWKALKRELGSTSTDEIRRAVSTMRDLEREFGANCAAVRDAVQAMHGFKAEYGMSVATVRASVGAWVGLRQRLREGLAPGGDLSGAGLAKTAAVLGASLEPASPLPPSHDDPSTGTSTAELGSFEAAPGADSDDAASSAQTPSAPLPAPPSAADPVGEAAAPGPSLHDAVGAWVSIRTFLRKVSDPEIHAAVATLESMQLDVPKRAGAQGAPRGAKYLGASGATTATDVDAHMRQRDHDEGHSAETCWPTPFETEEMAGDGSSFGIATVQRVQLVSGRVVEDKSSAPLEASVPVRNSGPHDSVKEEQDANGLGGVGHVDGTDWQRDGGTLQRLPAAESEDLPHEHLCRSDSDHAALLVLWPPVLALKREMRADVDAMAVLLEALAAVQRAYCADGRALADVLAACRALLAELGADVRDLTHSLLGFRKQLDARGGGVGGDASGRPSLLMAVVSLHHLLQGTNLAAAQIVTAVNALNSLVLRGDWDPLTLSESMSALAAIQKGSRLDAAALHDALKCLEELSRRGVRWHELQAALDGDGALKRRVADAERVAQQALEVFSPPDDRTLEDWRRERDALVERVGAGSGFVRCDSDVLLARSEVFGSWLRHRWAFAAWCKSRAARSSALDSDVHAPARWMLPQPPDAGSDEPPSADTVLVESMVVTVDTRKPTNSHPIPITPQTLSSSSASTGPGAQRRVSFGQCEILQTHKSDATVDRHIPRVLCQQMRLQLQHEMESRIQLQRRLSEMEEEVQRVRDAALAAERSLSLPAANMLDSALERRARYAAYEGAEPPSPVPVGTVARAGCQLSRFEDDLAFIRQVAAGDIDAPSLDPYLEVFKLKQRFDEWSLAFKHRMQVTYTFIKKRRSAQ